MFQTYCYAYYARYAYSIKIWANPYHILEYLFHQDNFLVPFQNNVCDS